MIKSRIHLLKLVSRALSIFALLLGSSANAIPLEWYFQDKTLNDNFIALSDFNFYLSNSGSASISSDSSFIVSAPPISSFPKANNLLNDSAGFVRKNIKSFADSSQQSLLGLVNRLEPWLSDPSTKATAFQLADNFSLAAKSLSLAGSISGAATSYETILGVAKQITKWGTFSIIGQFEDRETMFVLKTIAYADGLTTIISPEKFLLSSNAYIWGTLLPNELRKFGEDPPAEDFKYLFLPTEFPEFVYPSTGDAELDFALATSIRSAFEAAAYLEAANRSLDLYGGALEAGDADSALMQLKALLEYLDLFRVALDKASKDSAALAPLLDDQVYRAQTLIDLQALLLDPSVFADFHSYFSGLGFGSDDIDNLRSDFLSLNPYTYSGSASESLVQIQSGTYDFLNIRSVPAPGTLALVAIGLAGLAARRRLKFH